MITTGDIQSLIPQRPPFVMVDQLLSFTETTAHGGFRIKADNIFLENGFSSWQKLMSACLTNEAVGARRNWPLSRAGDTSPTACIVIVSAIVPPIVSVDRA